MIRYQVHYEMAIAFKGHGSIHGQRTVEAQTESEAKAKVRAAVPGSVAHWVNRLANEVA